MILSLPSVLIITSTLAGRAFCRTLFEFEQQQLTREAVASLPEDEARLFAFGDRLDTKAARAVEKQCRYAPADDRWPSQKAWGKLQVRLSSTRALIETVSQAAVCYGASKNDGSCQQLTQNWRTVNTHIEDPTGVLSPIYQGLTCEPPTIYDSGACTLGGSPAYVVKVKTVADIQRTINFARNTDLRLVVKNTGHDFIGKSAGHGALGIWTHGLKELLYVDDYLDDSGYRGPVIKAGAGVQAFELYKFASDKGVIAIAAAGQSVGVMGGCILGGCISPLSSIFGVAADHVLGFEVVTVLGDFVTANSTSNQDLFWALRGGGGGTFGVVTSVTIKVYKEMTVTAASWTLDSSKIGKEKFWDATKAFLDRAIDNVDAGTYSRFTITPTGQDFLLAMQPFFAPNKNANQTNAILAPYFSRLTSLNIPFSPNITEYKSFYPAWQAEFPLQVQSSVTNVMSSRLIARSNFASETGRNITFNVLRQTVEAGSTLEAVNMAGRGSDPANAVNPALRNSIYQIVVGVSINHKSPLADIMATRAKLTNGTMQKWRDITPGSGAYVNEADRMEVNWQQSFWGEKYARLLGIKIEMDRRNLLWAHHAVGSETWQVESFDGLPNENGRLCQVL